MPYIDKNNGRREALSSGESALNAGELNYQIFYFVKHNNEILSPARHQARIHAYIRNFLGDKPNYQKYNDVAGVLQCCADEVERRLELDGDFIRNIFNDYRTEIVAYEKTKIASNGDIE